VRLDQLVKTSLVVAATSKRTEKVRALASLLGELHEDEVETAVGVLVGDPRQGRTGVGWATVWAIDLEPAEMPTIELLELDEWLTALARTTGPGSVAARQHVIRQFLRRATVEELDFVRRLLLGEMRQGALAGVMADAVARASGVPLDLVRRAAMLGGDLRVAARLALVGGEDAVTSVGLTVGRPVQPMLAASASGISEALGMTGRASVEWKLDGARIQVHRNGDEVRIFTRNLNEVTERLPLVVSVARSFAATSFVLDGEALGIDAAGKPKIFQDTMSQFGSDGEGAASELQPFFFDVLHLDGTDLLDEPVHVRHEALTQVVGSWKVPAIVTTDPDEAQAFLDSAMTAGHEGVVVKAIDALYEAGRRGGSWRKVKPVRTLDLVVLAAEWGHGRRTGWLSNIHLGARGHDGEFVMVGKTFKGMTDELLRWQTAELQERAVRSDGHVVEVRPELVVEIALDGVQVSRRYPGGVALRFARVKTYRHDKSPQDADTIDAVRALLVGRSR
jgi:DNA ligase 1